MPRKLILTALALALLPTTGHAYIGPGLGAGMIAAVFGTLAAVAMAFVALLWYPAKRLLKKAKAKPALLDD